MAETSWITAVSRIFFSACMLINECIHAGAGAAREQQWSAGFAAESILSALLTLNESESPLLKDKINMISNKSAQNAQNVHV